MFFGDPLLRSLVRDKIPRLTSAAGDDFGFHDFEWPALVSPEL